MVFLCEHIPGYTGGLIQPVQPRLSSATRIRTTDDPTPIYKSFGKDYVSFQGHRVAMKISSEYVSKEFQLRLMYDCCDGGHFGLLYDLEVGECGGCGVEHFCVVCGFNAEDGSEALCLEV